jgi:NAD(P)-dependent dehydrogenase (short-subunit alcohol dehydrogenase family)
MADQAGRIAVVTGGGRGLGRAAALGLAGRGATVVAVSRNREQLEETAALAAAAAGAAAGSGTRDARTDSARRGRVIPIPADVTDPQAIDEIATRIEREVGLVTILVNAAGVFGPLALIQETDPREWIEAVNVLAIAPYLTTRAFLPGMLAAEWGRIVNVTSASSLHPPGPLMSAYGVGKSALNRFTRHLAAEIAGTGVTANVIHPGDVKTEMWADIREKASEARTGAAGAGLRGWVDWVAETGGDPPGKAVDLILRLTSNNGASINGRFCWIDNPLQPPIDSWEDAPLDRPWAKD